MQYAAPDCIANCPLLQGQVVNGVHELSEASNQNEAGDVVLVSYNHSNVIPASLPLQGLEDATHYLEALKRCTGPEVAKRGLIKTVYRCKAKMGSHDLTEYLS